VYTIVLSFFAFCPNGLSSAIPFHIYIIIQTLYYYLLKLIGRLDIYI
jgi:hypothetical protein